MSAAGSIAADPLAPGNEGFDDATSVAWSPTPQAGPYGVPRIDLPDPPAAIKLGLEFERRGINPPDHLGALVSEFRRRGLIGQQPGSEQPFHLSGQQQQRRATRRFEQIEGHIGVGNSAQESEAARRDYIDQRMGQWLGGLADDYAASAKIQQSDAATHIAGSPLTYQQRSDLFASIPDKTKQAQRQKFSEQFDAEHSPMAAFERQRQQASDHFEQSYRQAHPDAPDQEVYKHVHEELARAGFTPSFAGQLPQVAEPNAAQPQHATQFADVVPYVGDFLSPILNTPFRAVGSVASLGAGLVATAEQAVGLKNAAGGASVVAQKLANQQPIEDLLRLGPSAQTNQNIGKAMLHSLGAFAGDMALIFATRNPQAVTEMQATLPGMLYFGGEQAGQEQAQIYQALRAKGYSQAQAQRRATLGGVASGIVQSVTEKIPLHEYLTRGTAGAVRRAVRGAIAEGSQEAVQELTSVLIEKGVNANDAGYWHNLGRILMAGSIGAIAGGPTNAIIPQSARPQVEQRATEGNPLSNALLAVDRGWRAARQRWAASKGGDEQETDGHGAKGPGEEKSRGKTSPVEPPSTAVSPPVVDGEGREQGRRDPLVIATPKQMANWYTRTFGGGQNAQVVEDAARGANERFRLVDIPVNIPRIKAGEETGIGQGWINEQKLSAIAETPAHDLPPIIATTLGGGGGLVVADGRHRLMAARRRGDATIKGYVPESIARQIETGTYAPPTPETPPVAGVPSAGQSPGPVAGGAGGAGGAEGQEHIPGVSGSETGPAAALPPEQAGPQLPPQPATREGAGAGAETGGLGTGQQEGIVEPPIPPQKRGDRLTPDSRAIVFLDDDGRTTGHARIKLVPGPDGQGAFVAELTVGKDIHHGPFDRNVEEAQTSLGKLLKRHGLPATLRGKVEPTPSVPGTAPGTDESAGREDSGEQVVPRPHGKPKFGDAVTEDDLSNGRLAALIDKYGDFWLVLKWHRRKRQPIKASDFLKHHQQIVADAEVKANDALREVFVRKNPFEGIKKKGQPNASTLPGHQGQSDEARTQRKGGGSQGGENLQRHEEGERAGGGQELPGTQGEGVAHPTSKLSVSFRKAVREADAGNPKAMDQWITAASDERLENTLGNLAEEERPQSPSNNNIPRRINGGGGPMRVDRRRIREAILDEIHRRMEGEEEQERSRTAEQEEESQDAEGTRTEGQQAELVKAARAYRDGDTVPLKEYLSENDPAYAKLEDQFADAEMAQDEDAAERIEKQIEDYETDLVIKTTFPERRNPERGLHGQSPAELIEEAEQKLGALRAAVTRLTADAYSNPVTGAANRRAFEAALGAAKKESDATGKPFSFIALDAKNLKAVNDNEGDAAGDDYLREAMEAIQDSTRDGHGSEVTGKRPADGIRAFHYGGDEFGVLLLDTDADGAIVVRDRIEKALPQRAVGGANKVKTGLVGGVAVYEPGSGDVDEVLAAATNSLKGRKKEQKAAAGEAVTREEAEAATARPVSPNPAEEAHANASEENAQGVPAENDSGEPGQAGESVSAREGGGGAERARAAEAVKPKPKPLMVALSDTEEVPAATLDATSAEDATRIVNAYHSNIRALPRSESIDLDRDSDEAVDTAYRTVSTPIPGGGPGMSIFALPGKEKEVKEIAAKAMRIAKNPRSGSFKPGVVPGAKAPARKPKQIAPPAKTVQQKVLALATAMDKVDRRYTANGVKIDGETMIATDGHRMFIAEGVETGKAGRVYRVDKQGNLTSAGKDAKFPPWKDILPDYGPVPMATIKLADAYTAASRAATMAQDNAGVLMVLNDDDTLGFAASDPDMGFAEVGVKDGYRVLGAVNPKYFLDALDFHARFGDEQVTLQFPMENKPFVMKGVTAKTTSVTMPVKSGGEEYELRAAKVRQRGVMPLDSALVGDFVRDGEGKLHRIIARRASAGVAKKIAAQIPAATLAEDAAQVAKKPKGGLWLVWVPAKERDAPDAEEDSGGVVGEPMPGSPSGGVMASPMAELGFSPQDGSRLPPPANEPEPTPAAVAEGEHADSHAWAYNPLTAAQGSHRRTRSDVSAKVKQSLAKARARRGGQEAHEADNIYAIVSDLARRFNLGAPGVGRNKALAKMAAGFYRIGQENARLRRGSYASTFAHELGHHLHKIMFGRPGGRGGEVVKLSAKDFPKAWQKDLLTLGKDLYGETKPNGSYTAEGWAQVVRYLIVNPKHLRHRTPDLYNAVVRMLVAHHPEAWLVLQDARVRLKNAASLAQVNPVRQHVAYEPDGFGGLVKRATGGTWTNLWDWMRIRLFDRTQRLQTFKADLGLDKLADGLPADMDPHVMALRASGHISGDIKLAMERGTFDPHDPAKRRTGPGVIEILEPVRKNLTLWQDYMVARRTLEKRGQGYDVLPQDPSLKDYASDAKLRQFIEATEQEHPEFGDYFKRNGPEVRIAEDDAGEPIMVPSEDPGTVAAKFQQFNRWLVGEYAVGHGLVSDEAARLIMDRNLEYITFRHKKTEDALQRRYGLKSAGHGFANQSSGIGRFREGKGEQLFPPLESFFASMQGIMSRARLNQVARNITDFYERGTPGVGRWIEKIDRPAEAMVVSASQLSDEVRKQLGIGIGKNGEIVLPPYLQDLGDEQLESLLHSVIGLNGAQFWKPGNKVDRDNKEITVLRVGKPVFYEIKDRKLFDLLDGLGGPDQLEGLLRVLRIPGRVLRAGATQYNPSFFIPNFLRDLNQSLTMTESDLRKLPQQARLRLVGMKQAFLGGNYHELFLASGADMSGIFGEYYDPLTKRIKFDQMFDKPHALGLVKASDAKSTLKDMLRLGGLDRLNRSVELSNRLGEFAIMYEQAKARGAGESEAIAQAGQAAADITLDFQRGGTWAKQVNELIPFFNAAMLGADKLGRFIAKNPYKAMGRIFALTILPSITSLLMNWDNEDYWAKPLGMRDRYWYFPTGTNDHGDHTYVKIPKPYGLGIFSIAAERTFARLWGINPETGEPGGDPGAYRDVGKAIFNQLRPTINISGIQPLIEVNAGPRGYSFWRGHEIVSAADADLPLGEQGAERSSEMARVLGDVLNYPPAKIDYLVQGYFGGLGRDFVQVGIDPFIRQIDPNADEGEPMHMDDWLVVRRFLAGQTHAGHEAITRFYGDLVHLSRVRAGLNHRKGQPEKYEAYLEQHRAALALYPLYSRAGRRMGQGWAHLRMLYRKRDSLTADQFDTRVNETYKRIINTAQTTYKIRRQLKGK